MESVSHLMLHSEIHTKHTNTIEGQNVECFNVNPGPSRVKTHKNGTDPGKPERTGSQSKGTKQAFRIMCSDLYSYTLPSGRPKDCSWAVEMNVPGNSTTNGASGFPQSCKSHQRSVWQGGWEVRVRDCWHRLTSQQCPTLTLRETKNDVKIKHSARPSAGGGMNT